MEQKGDFLDFLSTALDTFEHTFKIIFLGNVELHAEIFYHLNITRGEFTVLCDCT
jgi:hypothetical protein